MELAATAAPRPYFKVTWEQDLPGVTKAWHQLRVERPTGVTRFGWGPEGDRRELRLDGDDYDAEVFARRGPFGLSLRDRTDADVVAEGASASAREFAALEQALVGAMSTQHGLPISGLPTDPIRFTLQSSPGLPDRWVSFARLQDVPPAFRTVLDAAQRIADRYDGQRHGGRPLVVTE